MGERSKLTVERVRSARSRLRTRTLPTLTAVLLLQISIATARRGYDLRALSSAFGLIVLLALALLAATVDALATFAATAAGEAMRVRLRFGPPAPVAVPPPPPITDDLLLDRRGRPLRGAARGARIAAIERERAPLAPVAAAPSGVRVIELPALPDLRTHPAATRLRSLLAAAYRRSLPAARYLWSPPIPRVHIPFPTLSMRGLRVVAITTTMTFVFATAIGTTGFIAQQGTIALGASTTVTIISGEVSVRASDAEGFHPVVDGTLLRAGMTIHTGPDTYAVLTYFEGSTVSIDPDTTLRIEALEASPDGSTVIAMQQQVGRTWHSVTKLLHQGSKYEVRTPTATATVRGTMFAVGVEIDERGEVVSTVETTEGSVGTAKAATPAEPQPQEVLVQPGFQVTVKQTAPIEPPRPAPEPERKVTVTVGASAGLVVDPVGRANGIKDGKVVVQTPGATVSTVDGKLVITLPKIPDGKVSTVVDPKVAPRDREVEVVTTVTERGRSEQRTEHRVQASTAVTPAVTAVEVKKGEAVEVAKVTDEQKKDIASSVKVAEAPKAPAAEGRKDERKGEESKDKERKDDGGGGPGGPSAPGFVPAFSLPPLPGPAGDQSGATLVGTRTEPAKDQGKEKDASRPPQQEQGSGASREQPKQEAPKAEAPGFVPKFELPRIEPAKVEAPKNDAPKVEAPKQEGSKTEASKGEQPRQEAPKQEASKEKSKSAPSGEASRFVPSLELPALPFPAEPPSPKKIELPFFQPAEPRGPERGAEPAKDRERDKDRDRDKDKRDEKPEPPKRGQVERDDTDRSNRDRTNAAGRGTDAGRAAGR